MEPGKQSEITKLAVVGGSGLFDFDGLQVIGQHRVETPYGKPSAPVLEGEVEGVRMLFLSRHGEGRHLPPHAINYRANIAALQQLGASHIVTINIVGGITSTMGPGVWVIPDQIIDYSWGREHSYSDGTGDVTRHVDFSDPYDRELSEKLLQAAHAVGLEPVVGGTYGCTQGPRLESSAEIQRLRQDGCDLVGMTAMPEAALARELDLPYAGFCLVVNWAAGISERMISIEEMQQVVRSNMPSALIA